MNPGVISGTLHIIVLSAHFPHVERLHLEPIGIISIAFVPFEKHESFAFNADNQGAVTAQRSSSAVLSANHAPRN